MESSLFFLVAVIAGGLFLLWMILYFIPIGLWFQALVSDVKISLLQLVLMRWRKVPLLILSAKASSVLMGNLLTVPE